ncbi:hypothetical protein BN874_90003 [Candidatus Contendobacter odensis Run_B_J11]|uniref:Uncharacterized protein n=1 Tax=Candidatus Contendobacter odensis Run_B_J11 TaxID=1400861 RepID=A0A7U7GG84_9GAMM|nr:hypothetical protein BN874_90003 [Candidatus Contendobacter odensis Run_B_J11]
MRWRGYCRRLGDSRNPITSPLGSHSLSWVAYRRDSGAIIAPFIRFTFSHRFPLTLARFSLIGEIPAAAFQEFFVP